LFDVAKDVVSSCLMPQKMLFHLVWCRERCCFMLFHVAKDVVSSFLWI
jgi:hypothetical protein